ncbi:hypothetical protein [Pseudomonas phage PA1C]|nr:hypothetical protein [Pseudomonas phage PA1C]
MIAAPPAPGKVTIDGLRRTLSDQIEAEISLACREIELTDIRYVDQKEILEIVRRFRNDVRTTITDKGK